MEPHIVALLQGIADCAARNEDVDEWPESAVDRLEIIYEQAEVALYQAGHGLAPKRDRSAGDDA